jgi:hypothetical protein
MPTKPGHQPGPRPPYRGAPRPGAGLRGGRPPWWGTRPGRLGVAFVISGAAVGALITVLAGIGPGLVLGLFLVAGTVAAAFAVQPRAVYLIIPVPALAYLTAAIAAGVAGGQADGSSHAALAVGAAQWIASGFRPMTAATAVALAVTVARWPRGARAGPP